MRLSDLIVACAASVSLAHAGPLTPPAGPVTSTGKTLSQVEPRTPISGPTVITQPGSYYLTGNVTTTFRGIEIQSAGVTLDLNGFSVIGDGVGTTADIGILYSASDDDRPVVIRNGFVRNFTGDGVATSSSGDRVIIEGVHVSETFRGFDILGPAIVRNCTARNCSDIGVALNDGTVENVLSEDNLGIGIRVATATLSDCFARGNADSGFSVSLGGVLRDCIAEANGGLGFLAGASYSLSGCVAVSNASDGIRTGSGASIASCEALSNGQNGIVCGFGSTLSGCASRTNTFDGFSIGAGSSAISCVATGNQQDGFELGSDVRVFQCTADGNGTSGTGFTGFRGNSDTTIDSCTATDNPNGIIGGTGGLVIRCSAAGNSVNFFLTGADFGEIISPAGQITTSNPFANISY